MIEKTLERRIEQEPGVVAVTLADRAPGSLLESRRADVEMSPGASSTFDYGIGTAAVGPKFFEVFDRPIVIGRAFHSGDRSPAARTVIVNEAFVRTFEAAGEAGRRSALACSMPIARPRQRRTNGSRSLAWCATSV